LLQFSWCLWWCLWWCFWSITHILSLVWCQSFAHSVSSLQSCWARGKGQGLGQSRRCSKLLCLAAPAPLPSLPRPDTHLRERCVRRESRASMTGWIGMAALFKLKVATAITLTSTGPIMSLPLSYLIKGPCHSVCRSSRSLCQDTPLLPLQHTASLCQDTPPLPLPSLQPECMRVPECAVLEGERTHSSWSPTSPTLLPHHDSHCFHTVTHTASTP